MPSQFSQIVVAPASIIASHDGTVSWKSSSYATSRCPVSARTGKRYGVARKPVDRWVAGGPDQLDQPRRRPRPQLVGDETEGQGADEVGLGVGA